MTQDRKEFAPLPSDGLTAARDQSFTPELAQTLVNLPAQNRSDRPPASVSAIAELVRDALAKGRRYA